MHKISGIVVHGDGYGRKLGFPTANLDKKNEVLEPGVYAGNVETDGKVYRAGILINPTGKVEAHLLNFDGDLYDKMITLEVGKFIREYKKFDTEEELINQIKKDIALC
jgi:riboflavin kinase/FMN adenylyltransferase